MKELSEMTHDELVLEVQALRRELRLISLRRQVTPHFLFNSLSVAMGLVMQSPKTAVQFLRHLARMYRYLLKYGNEYYVPIEQEVDMLRQYYELMSVRHVDSIRLNISHDVLCLKGYPLPPLTLQGLLENAIKHNTHTRECPLEVNIAAMQIASRRYLCVSNPIVPLMSHNVNEGGFGLDYMNESMQLLLDSGIEVINDKKKFTVRIPLIEKA